MKITPVKKSPEKITMKTRPRMGEPMTLLAEWYKTDPKDEVQVAKDLLGTVTYLKTEQTYRVRQLAVAIRMYCGLNVYSYAGSSVARLDRTRTLPDDRPTFNLVQACTDTLVSRLSQNQPQPKFLTDNADYKQRHLAQQLNRFVLGEFYQTKVYEKATKALRDCVVMGTGALKVYEDESGRVAVDRVLVTDLYVDDNDSLNGTPQQLHQLKLMDRSKLMARLPDEHKTILDTPNSYPDNAPASGQTVADQVMMVESWKLASGPDPEAKGYIPGRHIIATMGGTLLDEVYDKIKFPFVFMVYQDPFSQFFGQGIAAQLFGTQMTLNRILYTIARAITLVGVPRVFIEQGAKVVKAHQNNEVGVIITYSGTKPSYEVAPCNAPELYAERDKLIQYGFQQCGVSMMQASSQKPQGLDSGAALRSFDDISTDRMAELAKKYDNVFVELAYQITDVAKEISERDGKYQTIYPNKDGTKEIDLPKMKILKDPFVIQCFSESQLPRTPSGRMAWIGEQVQAGMITIKEGRRLMRVPQDIEQNEQLDNASEERIFKILDNIVDEGKYEPPDIFLDAQLATQLTVQYINLYFAANLEDNKKYLLIQFFNQVQAILLAATPPPMPQGPAPGGQPVPQANPEALPTSPLVPNAVGQTA